jgi:hypothetical protein
MHYLIGLLIAAIVSLSQTEAANVKGSTPVLIVPQAIMVAKPAPKKPKTQAQPYMTIKLNDALITSY